MDAPTCENLDLACAKASETITEKPSKELEKLITSALAVLEEQGMYALFLFLKTPGGAVAEKNIIKKKMVEFLKMTPQQAPLLSDDANADDLNWLLLLAEGLDKLLLARDLVRQTLVYARYHARVTEESPEESEAAR